MKLLIGYDGSAAADGALRDLEMAGLPAEGEALVLTALPPALAPESFAVDPTGAGWLAGAYTPMEPTPEQIATARGQADHAAGVFHGKFPRWKVSAETAVGTPAQALLEKADAWHAGLIAVGSHGWSWLGRTLIGSTAEKVLAHAKTAVRLCNPSPATHAAPRILAAVDGSRDSRHALETISKRHWPKGARVRLIAAKRADAWSDALDAAESAGSPRLAPPGSWAQMERLMEAAAARLQQAGLEAEWEIQEGDPRRVILAAADAFHADCVFLGRRGLSGFDRLLLGSVSSSVAAHAPCSVEVVPC